MHAVVDSFTTAFFITQKDELLSQYQKLVSHHYAKELGITLCRDNDNWNVATIKQQGDTLVAVRDNKVIGGSMIYTSTGANHQLLPLEAGKSLLPSLYDFDLNDLKYGELGRLTVAAEYRSMPLLTELVNQLFTHAASMGLNYLFVIAPTSNAILYRRICRQLGVPVSIKDLPGKVLSSRYQHLSVKILCAEIHYLHTKPDLAEVFYLQPETTPVAMER